MVNGVAAGQGFDLLNQERAKDGKKAHASIIKEGGKLNLTADALLQLFTLSLKI